MRDRASGGVSRPVLNYKNRGLTPARLLTCNYYNANTPPNHSNTGDLNMARPKAQGVSKSSVFTRIFEANKDLLKIPSIAEALTQFEAEYGQAPTQSDRGLAANIKSR